jgi:hypothetical protein
MVAVLVDVQRVADEGADLDVVDVEDRELLDLGLVQRLQQLGIELVAGLAIDFARAEVDDVLGQILAGQVVGAEQNLLEAALGQLARAACRDLLSPALATTSPTSRRPGRRRRQPRIFSEVKGTFQPPLSPDDDRLVEGRQDILVVEAKRVAASSPGSLRRRSMRT